MNNTLLIAFFIAITILIVFLVVKNVKDKDKYENQQNDDYHKLKSDSPDDQLL
jgi:cell division protein FtsI/penicillin-binding protein 2